MLNKVAQQLRERYDQFTVAERMIAGWLLDNMASIPFETAASIGQRVGVSAMTVSRFLKSLGYSGLAALKDDLRGELGDAPWLLPPKAGAGPDSRLMAETAAIADVYRLAQTPEWAAIVALGFLLTSSFALAQTTTDAGGNYSFNSPPAGSYTVRVDAATLPAGLDALPAYMKLFAYGMTCDAALGATPVVQLQRGPAWCSAFAARRVLQQQKCVTHQLMGFMLMQQRHCGDAAQVAAVTRQLQDRVVDELALDFVVRDEHLQRVLMLYWTGAPERVKPVWLNRALRAQRPDGGWDYESAYAHWPAPADPAAPADFHATAQGLLILALALQQAETPGR